MAKNYEIVEKRIIVDMEKATEKEIAIVKKYLALGYSFEEKPVEKLTWEQKKAKTQQKKAEVEQNKAQRVADQKANPYSKINVEAFLSKEENKEYFEEYTRRYNEQAGTNRTRKNTETGQIEKIDNEPKFTKDGEPKKKGFANCIGWFTSNFEWDEEKETYIKK